MKNIPLSSSYLFSFDVGYSIELDKLEERLALLKTRTSIKQKRHAPTYFDFEPKPLKVTKILHSSPCEALWIKPEIEFTVYDYGAVTLSFRSEKKEMPFDEWILFHTNREELKVLTEKAWEEIHHFIEQIGESVNRKNLSDFIEDYFIHHIPLAYSEEFSEDQIAKLLRSEPETLSQEEIKDATSQAISYSPYDRTFVDWNAALVFGEEIDEALSLLDFANSELLELRFTDHRLDQALERHNQALHTMNWKSLIFPGKAQRYLKEIATLQLEETLLFESVNNALKLMGDQYLARLYQVVTKRFYLESWHKSIFRKLQTLESIFDKLSNYASSYRMEFLEWIIILLITVSILLPMIGIGVK